MPDWVRRIDASCHAKGLAFVRETAREVGCLTPRRSGKTEHLARRLRRRTLMAQEGVVQYWAITRLRAKQLLWDKLKALDRSIGLKDGVDVEYNETELVSTLSTGVKLHLLGADKPKEADKKRGDAVLEAAFDEAQMFAGYLQAICENVVSPSLADLKGTMTLAGTPGPVCAGYWYDITTQSSDAGKKFRIHGWSAKDNTFRPDLWEDFLGIKERRGWTDDNPTWRREYLGEWVEDAEALFYAFNPGRNLYSPTPTGVWPEGDGWQHVLAWDLGAVDDMALVVWGWNERRSRNLYEAFSWKKPGTGMDDLVQLFRQLDKRYDIISQVADTGGGGKAFVDEFQRRFGISFKAAKKKDKAAHVRLFNDDLRTSRVQLIRGSQYAEEIAVLTKDPDWDPKEHDGLDAPENPQAPNHCCDAGLYGWRDATAYLHAPEEEKPAPGSVEEFMQWESEVLAKRRDRRQLEEDGYAQWAEE